MNKRKVSNQDLNNQWEAQLRFLKRSSIEYDKGDEQEAKRIAIGLRVLFHNSQFSKSLVKTLGFDQNLVLLSTGDYTPTNISSSWELVMMQLSNGELRYLPHFSDIPIRTFFLGLDDWWNEVIFDDRKFVLSRKDIVLIVANQDGGAHVDPEVDERYARIVQDNSLGWNSVMTDGTSSGPVNNPVYASVRQVAHEVEYSIMLNQQKYERRKSADRKFEMRYLDETRRFKWSSTDKPSSTEIDAVINQYNARPRIHYIDRFVLGGRREVIL